jgi:hypothetical protein
MNSDSGCKRDSEEYNNPTERQDEQAARHQDEGIYRLEMFFRNGVLLTFDAPLFLIVREVTFLCVQNKN